MNLKGKYADAVVYADIVEEKAAEQIQRMCDYEFTAGSRIRIMPDVHAGKGCTIGTTMTVTDKVVPNIVGVDIGCGMFTVELAEREIDLKAMDEAAHGIPSGRDVWEEKQESFDLTGLACCHELKEPLRLEKSIGTLGGGNHFIEVDRASDGRLFLVIHSGSRNLGKQVAEYYQSLAVRLNEGWEDTPKKREEVIASLKAAGREKEIQKALAELKAAKRERTVPDDLCYVYGEALADYLHDVKLCQSFALRNRERMAKILLSHVGLTAVDAFHTIHNYIDTDEMILRKGAIAAHQGERVLIPVNMRDGSILAVGRGNPEWNFSAPHGAGRLMSRIKAKEQLSMEEFREAMAGVYTTSVSPDTLDEAPMAYKSLEDILGFVRDSVDVIDILKPIYNFKAAE